ncbi:MAG: hypothetical protein ACRENI_00815 [Gemmatimonadaceae bacterium]
MDPYHIEKFRYPVVLRLLGGAELAGDMFVQTRAPYREGPEAPPDILNGQEPYFPLVREDGQTLLVAKDRVVDVQAVMPEDADPLRMPGARASVLEFTLAGGLVLSGEVLLELPADRARPLDYLNRLDERFLTLRTADGLRFLNRRLIELVRPLD